MKANPFFDLYVGERLSAEDFVTIFSPYLVQHAGPLFQAGNVVVTGVQGSGKSMLLSLLKPDVRLKYSQRDEEFPVPAGQRKFLSASVNLAHSNVIDFGYRRHESNDVEFLFADFLNYLMVRSFLQNIQFYFSRGNGQLWGEVGLDLHQKGSMDEIASVVSGLNIWEGWIGKPDNFEGLIERIDKRIVSYRRFLHKKDKVLGRDLVETRTAIGEPMIDCAQALISAGIIQPKTNIFVDIDQYEELGNISNDEVEIDYRKVINRALANRNPAISYRIGTRGHAWRDHSKIMGTTARLEEERDYKYVDLDLILRRYENAKTYIFPKFAEDIFFRRLKFSLNGLSDTYRQKILDRVYGKTPPAKEKAKKLNIRDIKSLLRPNPEWGADTVSRLRGLAEKEPLHAVLGEAWLRQKGEHMFDPSVRDDELPWLKSKYWRKERDEVALMQLASRARQQPLWGGGDDVADLSGGNVLVFLSINQFIWDTWLQSGEEKADSEAGIPQISFSVQTLAILKASEFWVRKINQETGHSSERARFVRHVAATLARKLMEDTAMSNPGHNGFSVSEKDLEEHPRIYEFLKELADYGNCIMQDHTTKNKDARTRKKWYFNPVFCPSFSMPYIRTKEPFYANMATIVEWVYEAGHRVKLTSVDETDTLPLFEA